MLIGKNVSLRPATLADQKILVEWFNDPEFLGPHDNHWPSSLEQMEREHHEAVRKDIHCYMITSRETGEPMGEILYCSRFSDPDFHGQEIGYAVHPAFRGRGVATQASCLLINHLFDATPVCRIQATVIVGNEISCRVLEHSGMTHEGILRGLLFVHGRYVDMHMYSILRSEWCDEQTYRRQVRDF